MTLTSSIKFSQISLAIHAISKLSISVSLVNSNSVMLLNKGKNLVKKGEVLKIIPFNVNFYNNTNVFNN